MLELQKKVLGPEHPDTLRSMNNLANAIKVRAATRKRRSSTGRCWRSRRKCWAPSIPQHSGACATWPTRFCIRPATRRRRSSTGRCWSSRRKCWAPSILTRSGALNNLAGVYTNWCWQLATAADVSQRDPAKAVELANKAIGLRPDSANNWNNLGVAQYRAGDWQAAVEAMEKADAMIEGGDRPHRMFLAMAHWQLGNQDKARELYAQGAAWIAAHAQNDEEQQRFRAEAEQLMGITEECANSWSSSTCALCRQPDPSAA